MSENDPKQKPKPESPASPGGPGTPDAPADSGKPATPGSESPATPGSESPATNGEAPPSISSAAAAAPASVPGGGPGGQFELPAVLPVLPIRGTVMFPGTVMPLGVGRPGSRKLLDESLPESKIIALVTQRDEQEDDPATDGLHGVGTAAMVVRLLRQPDETVSIIVHGLGRVRFKSFLQTKPYMRATVERVAETPGEGQNFTAAVNQLRDQARRLIEITPNAPEQALTVLMNIEDPSNLSDFLAANLNLDLQQKQDLLEEPDVAKRVRTVLQHVSNQLEIVKLQQKIQQDVQSTIGESQRKYFLREQLKAIQKELGEEDEGGTGQTVAELRRKLEEAKPPEKVMAEATRDLNRLGSIPPASPEYSLILTYLELLADLPWNKRSEDNLDLARARRILDRDHFDLDKVKRRLIEFLAVRKLNPQGRGPILCLLGPPGVGKTSLGQSIADALGRKFARLSFGGIRDEAEIRGHRRTYIGAMPGRIIQELRRAGTNNPVMMLDEVDKLGADFRGDPASALLEVLDPRQNHAFVDRYLDVPFDLSQVIFIATANYMGTVPPPLRDRMEVIDIPGYTDNDKAQISRAYLIPRQLAENGLDKKRVRWTLPGVRKVIYDYTREAGVRELERQIGAVSRGIAAEVAGAPEGRAGEDDGQPTDATPPSNGQADAPPRRESPPPPAAGAPSATGKRAGATPAPSKTFVVDEAMVRKLLGPERHVRELDVRTGVPGVVVGLAYTPVGGDVLFIEAASYPGRGRITLTGQIGDVMKESASAALSLLKTRAGRLKLDPKVFADRDIHVHVPAGAVPKDGPSAGVSMFTALASLFLNTPVQPRLAMTGEITLRGRVLPIGGVKEKTLAAMRAGIRTIVLPEQNRRDLEEVDAEVKRRCKFVFVENVDQLLTEALGARAPAKVAPRDVPEASESDGRARSLKRKRRTKTASAS